MLLIYTHKITPRFSYTMKHVFTRILGIETVFTTKVEDFIKHTGAKITYTKQPLQNEFFVRSNDLLFEQGITDFDISLAHWDEVPCFFQAGERSNIPFDIFAASFYLISRYEEYLPHVKDQHGRFSYKDSLAFKYNFLQLPVIDIWAKKLLGLLLEKFDDLTYKKRHYKYTSVIDVTSSHCYANRGFTRGVAGFLFDLSHLKFKRIAERFSVLLNPEKDPYNNYEFLIETHKNKGVKSNYFFQFAAYSTYDKNVSPNNNSFRFLIKHIADYSKVSLSASYSSFDNIDLLKTEKKTLAEVLNRAVNYSRMRYNRVDIPTTYRNLVEAEFTDDFTMGYTHEMGFRAGTSIPFYFYDIGLEVQQPIRVHPFAIHDYALVNYNTKTVVLEKCNFIYQQIRNTNGCFVTVFSNELLGGEHIINWKNLYSTVLEKFHANK